jgi:hypothetical protein
MAWHFGGRARESVGDFLDSLKPNAKRERKLEDGLINKRQSELLSAPVDLSDEHF